MKLLNLAAAAALMTILAMTAAPTPARADASPRPAAIAQVNALLTQMLSGEPNQEVQMMTVEYGPAGSSPPHRHHAQVFVYVLEGTIRMQVAGAAPVTLNAGGTFYEGPEDVHTMSQNTSATKPARLLVFMIKDKGAPVSIPASAGVKP